MSWCIGNVCAEFRTNIKSIGIGARANIEHNNDRTVLIIATYFLAWTVLISIVYEG